MKKLALILMTLTVLASCKKTEGQPTPPPEPELVPIHIATAVTRATDYAFETGDDVGLYVVNEPKSLQSNGNHIDNGKFSFDARNGPPVKRSTGWTPPPRLISSATTLTRPPCLQQQPFRSRSDRTKAQRAATRHRILCGGRSPESPLLRIRWRSRSITV